MSSIFNVKQAPQFTRSAVGHLTAALDDKLRLTIKSFNYNAYLDIREYFLKSSTPMPTKRGVTLTMDEWTAINALLAEVNSLIINMNNAIKDSNASLKPVKLRVSERVCVSVAVQRTKLNLSAVRVILEKTSSCLEAKENNVSTRSNSELSLTPLAWQTLFAVWRGDVDAAFQKFHAECAAERVKQEQQVGASEDALFKSFLNLNILA